MSENRAKVVRVDGKVDAMSSKTLENDLLAGLAETEGVLIVDFATCAYVSSAGLRALLIAAKEAKQREKKLILCGINPILS